MCLTTSHIGKEHWIGLDNIYKLTNRKNVKTELRIDLELFSGKKTSVTYDDFYLKAQVVYNFTYKVQMMIVTFFIQT